MSLYGLFDLVHRRRFFVEESKFQGGENFLYEMFFGKTSLRE